MNFDIREGSLLLQQLPASRTRRYGLRGTAVKTKQSKPAYLNRSSIKNRLPFLMSKNNFC